MRILGAEGTFDSGRTPTRLSAFQAFPLQFAAGKFAPGLFLMCL